MTVSRPPAHPRRRVAAAAKALLAATLGASAALLVACGSSGKGLIPASAGGPLQGDIEAVYQAAQNGNGNCSATEAALLKTDQDFAALPASVDSGLRNTLRTGIENLHKVAREACAQPIAQTTTTSAPKTTSTPTTTSPTTTSTPTTPSTTPTTPTTPEHSESPGAGGGTPAPGEGLGKAPGEGSGGAGAEENPQGNGAAPGNGAGGAEGAK